MKLCIISHTEHYKTQDGEIVGWGPTVNEINHLTDIFDEIYHVAMLHKYTPPPSALPYSSPKIKFVPLPALGGKTVGAKLCTLWNAPKVISVVNKTLGKVDYFQLRTPTGIGVFLIPYLTLFVQKKGWFKYAGNWNQKHSPLGYAFQRFMLKKQRRKVTINGNWSNQPSHCITFENPCLKEQDLAEGKIITERKKYDDKLNFCFVGRLEQDKGVERIIKAFTSLDDSDKKRVGHIDFVGDGDDISYYKDIASKSGVRMAFHGALPRKEVFEIYKQAHIFLLPSSASEGFPKVIAEAFCFGCFPVVSNISSINQYVRNDVNGYLLDDVRSSELKITLQKLFVNASGIQNKLLNEENNFSKLFLFKTYNYKILELINEF